MGYRDRLEEYRAWAVFDWDEDGWTAFATDPETPGIMQEAGHLRRPSLGQSLGTFPGSSVPGCRTFPQAVVGASARARGRVQELARGAPGRPRP